MKGMFRTGLILLAAAAAACAPRERTLVLLSTNDMHAKIQRFPQLAAAVGACRDTAQLVVLVDAGEGGDVDETDRHRGIYFVTQLLDAVVDEGCEEGVKAGREAFGDLQQWGSHRDVDLGAEVFTDDFDDVWHNGFSQIMVGKDRKNLYF